MPAWLRTEATDSYDKIAFVAVSVQRTDAETDRWHAGVIHRSFNGGPQHLHLKWHERLASERPNGLAWVQPAAIHVTRRSANQLTTNLSSARSRS